MGEPHRPLYFIILAWKETNFNETIIRKSNVETIPRVTKQHDIDAGLDVNTEPTVAKTNSLILHEEDLQG